MTSSPALRGSLNGHSTFRLRQFFSEPRGQDTSSPWLKVLFEGDR